MLQCIINIKKYQYMYNCLERPPKWSLKRGYFTYFMKSCDIFKVISNNGQVRKSRLFNEFNVPTEHTTETFCMLFSMFLLLF